MSIATESVKSQDDQMGFASDGDQYLTFALGEEQYGVEILRVQEIKGYTGVTRIPNTPNYVKGVLNLRGTIVPIVDLRMKFGMEQQEYDKKTVIIVVEVKGRIMGIIVDAVSDVMNIAAKDIQPAPEFGSMVDVGFINGIGSYGEKLVAFLDIDRVLSVSGTEEFDVPETEQ
ncbi:Positive regulator of CheA protein activity (CheW) [hydrothermal vent metagenome]|uniref:Chemotaxis protein CheW n=1 Tax=hydrothermal vent metagenome TaxID=652676 RepID=A0A3B1D370_9ZZZZ